MAVRKHAGNHVVHLENWSDDRSEFIAILLEEKGAPKPHGEYRIIEKAYQKMDAGDW